MSKNHKFKLINKTRIMTSQSLTNMIKTIIKQTVISKEPGF